MSYENSRASHATPATIVADAYAASQERDVEALGRLYAAYQEPLVRYLAARSYGDVHLAQDLAGETWTKVIAKIDTYSPARGEFVAWLYTIAKRVMFNHAKSAHFSRTVHLAPHLLAAERWIDTGAGPEAVTTGGGVREVIVAAVENLPARQRECVVLHYWGGLSLSETAAVTGKSLGAVKQLTHRALVALRPMLENFAPSELGEAILIGLASERATEVA